MRESWRRIFSGGAGTRLQVTQQVATQAMMVAIHSVHETVPARGKPVTVVATNVYLRTAVGWRMILHHASQAPGLSEGGRAEAPPKILH